MALWPFRRREPASLTAAAVNLVESGPEPYRARKSEDPWQKEAWRQYDICGELRFAVQWISNAISLADMYAAEIDPATGLAGERTDNAQVQAVVDAVFGGTARRPQAQSTIATNWQIAGEAFMLIRPRGAGLSDEWLIMSSTEIEEKGGAGFEYIDPVTGKRVPVRPRDKLIRLWNPHPSRQVHADSAVRSALPVLREIERTSQNIAARLVSRIAMNGVWFYPEELDYTRGDDDPEGPDGLADLFARAGEAAMRDVGQPSSQIPVMVPVSSDLLELIKEPVRFDSDVPAEILELREAAIKRLAACLDMPGEIMTGMGESNHWNAWQIEEAAYKIHVAPVLDRLSSALTSEYLHPILAKMGVPDPERYVIAFSTAEIISRPNRTDELMSLWDKRLISDDYMRAEAGVPDTAKPDDDEAARRLLEGLVGGAPTLLADPSVQDALGIDLEVVPEGAVPVEAVTDPDTPPAPVVRALPVQQEPDDVDPALVAAAELAVFDALSRAGARMLTREHRGRFQSTPKHELYRVIPTVLSNTQSHALMADSFAFIDPVADAHGLDTEMLRTYLRTYTAGLVLDKREHRRADLVTSLEWVVRHGRA